MIPSIRLFVLFVLVALVALVVYLFVVSNAWHLLQAVFVGLSTVPYPYHMH